MVVIFAWALAFTLSICSSKAQRDIDFFSADNINRYCKRDFLKTVPDKINRDERNDKSKLTYLQGYRGPEELISTKITDLDSKVIPPSNGVQEVRYWHGCTKHLHWIPLFGSVTWLVIRKSQDTRWRRLFFDANSGEFLKLIIENSDWVEPK